MDTGAGFIYSPFGDIKSIKCQQEILQEDDIVRFLFYFIFLRN